jgi:hypothetical protein
VAVAPAPSLPRLSRARIATGIKVRHYADSFRLDRSPGRDETPPVSRQSRRQRIVVLGPLVIAGLIAFAIGMIRLGRSIPPRPVDRDEALRRGAELSFLPFGRQPTEPVDADRARVGRPF